MRTAMVSIKENAYTKLWNDLEWIERFLCFLSGLNLNYVYDYIGGHLKKEKKGTVEENESSETLLAARRASFRILL